MRERVWRTMWVAVVAAVLVSVLAPSAAWAATTSWTGGGSTGKWSDPANWSATVPTSGDDLVLSATSDSMTNDLPTGTVLGSIRFAGNARPAIGGGTVAVSGGMRAEATAEPTFTAPVRIAADQEVYSTDDAAISFLGAVDLEGRRLTIAGQGGATFRSLVGAGRLVVSSGAFAIVGANDLESTTGEDLSEVLVRGDHPGPIVMHGRSVLNATDAATGPLTVGAGGTIHPEPFAARGLTVHGTLIVAAEARLSAGIRGPQSASGSSRVSVVGPVRIGGSHLHLWMTGEHRPAVGERFRLIDNDGTDAIDGTFRGVPEGQRLAVGDRSFRLTYRGGDGNDVEIETVADQPAIVGGGPAPTTPAPPPPPRSGYWMVGSDGEVHPFGDAMHFGDATMDDVVDLEPTPSGNGYWVVNAIGQVHSFGDAPYEGGSPAMERGETVTSMSAARSGGYWLFTTRGRVIAFGGAPHLGDMSRIRLNGPVLDSVPTPSGLGYYMVASDGGIFTFGDASFRGSMGDRALNAPVQSLVPDPDGGGYWLVAADGGIFSFDADFHGSMGGTPLNRPVTGMVGSPQGYLMVAEDGGIFTFGAADFHGSLGAAPPPNPIRAVATVPAVPSSRP